MRNFHAILYTNIPHLFLASLIYKHIISFTIFIMCVSFVLTKTFM
jgi:hypothetical protein